MKTPLILAAMCLLLLSVPALAETDSTEEGNPPPEFQVALQKFANWRDSLDSLEVEYSWENPHNVYDETGTELISSGLMPCRTRMKWQDWWTGADGQRMKVFCEMQPTNAAPFRTSSGSDGKVQYYAEFDQFGMFPRLVSLIDFGPKRTLQNFNQMPLFPIYFAINGWFSGAFEHADPKYAGMQEIDGHLCVGVAQGYPAEQVMWIDLEHDGLPRQIDNPGATSWTWKCDEFEQVGSKLWFPKRGQFSFPDGNVSEFEVNFLAINEAIPASEFDLPVVERSTNVRDMTEGGTELVVISRKSATPVMFIAGWRLACGFIILFAGAGWWKWGRQPQPAAVRKPAVAPVPQWV